MRQTPSEMRMHDTVTIDTIVFEIEGVALKPPPPPPPRIVNFLNYPRSNRVKKDYYLLLSNICYSKLKCEEYNN